MPAKKYSVFVSSVYKGMQEARVMVSTAVAEAGCFPEGMERFEVSTRNKWAVIRSAINQSDFFVVVVGGRYGSIVPDQIVRNNAKVGFPGVGYTEMEYRFAKNANIPILPFLSTSDNLLAKEAMLGETLDGQHKLQKFREILDQGSPGYWENAQDLRNKVEKAVHEALQKHPHLHGWVRGTELNFWKDKSDKQEKEIEKLKGQLQRPKTQSSQMESLLDGMLSTEVRGMGNLEGDDDSSGRMLRPMTAHDWPEKK